MGDEITITSGAVVQVDTASLRRAAVRVGVDADGIRGAAERVARAGEALFDAWAVPEARGLAHRCSDAARRLSTAADGLDELGGDLRTAADTYELAELRAQWLSAGDAGDGSRTREGIEDRIVVLARRLLGDEQIADADAAWHALARARIELAGRTPRSLEAQVGFVAALAGGIGGALWAGAAIAALRGAIALHTSARGTAAPRAVSPSPRAATVAPVWTAPARPPTGLAAAARRIPGGDAARVRVERYDLPGGRREWMVYVAGTQSAGLGGADPFDMRSNLQLYSGEGAASVDAVRAAMDAAGVAPGEAVHLATHSQGAMIGVALAGADPDVRTLITFGSPVPAEVAPDVLAIDVRHADDPVAALAGPAPIAAQGSSGSVQVSRVVDPLPHLGDATLPAHHMEAYVETARLVEASADPRLAEIERLWQRLGDAERVTRTDFSAARGSLSPASPSAAG